MNKSIKNALNGLFRAFATQKSLWIQSLISIVAIFAGFYFTLSRLDWLALVICIGTVIGAELFNTAIEELVNFISPEYHIQAGLIKDIAAGAVLFLAIIAVFVGGLIFIPKVVALLP